ncbi:transposase [Pontibacter ramchanderi]|uniref:transposase n=1 Tax=Pontibacter ramchanderi TaxID=1179743 RepID=UPI000C702D52|nr:transposase [Pontibacter ramchanderi]
MLVACIDNIKAIASVFPQAEVQNCIVHQIRCCIKYVGSSNWSQTVRQHSIWFRDTMLLDLQ